MATRSGKDTIGTWRGPAARSGKPPPAFQGRENVRSLPHPPPECTLIALEKSGRITANVRVEGVAPAALLAQTLAQGRRIADNPVSYAEFILVCGDGVVIRLNSEAQWQYRQVV